MSVEFNDPIDLNQLELQNAGLQRLNADPLAPVEGQVWYRNDLNRPRVNDGSNQSLAYLDDLNDLDYLSLDACDIQRDPSGFANPDAITETYDAATRTVTLTTTDASLRTVLNGVIHDFGSNTWTSSAHTNSAGQYYLSSTDGANFTWSTSMWEFYQIQCAAVKYVSSTKAIPLRECHGVGPWNYHKSTHLAIGTQRDSSTPTGGTIGGYTIGSTATADRRPSATVCTLLDEDLKTTVAALTDGGPYSHLQLSSATTLDWVQGTELEICHMSGTTPQWQSPTTAAWSNIGPNDFANVYLVAIPTTADAIGQAVRWVWMQPQATYSNITLAKAESFLSINRADLNAAFAEFLPVARVTIKCSAVSYFSIEYVEAIYGTRTSASGVPASAATIASAVAFSPVGTISSTDVQAAIAELDVEVMHLAGDEAPTGNKTFASKLVQIGSLATQSIINGSLIGKLGFVADDDSASQSLRRAAEIEAVGTMTWNGSVSGVKLAHKLWFGPDAGFLRDVLVLENGDGGTGGRSYVKATGTLQVMNEDATNGARIELARPNGVLASVYGYLPGDTTNTVVLTNTSGNGVLQLITNASTPGYIAIGGGDSASGITDTYVRISDSPIAEGNIGNACAANMGGYGTTAFGIWGGDAVPSTNNYGLYIKGDASTAEISGITYSYLSVGSAGRVRAGTDNVLISPTSVTGEQLVFKKYTGSSAAAIYNNGAGTPDDTNYSFYASSTGTIVNAPSSSVSLAVNHTYILQATSSGVAVTGTLSATGTATFNGGLAANVFNANDSYTARLTTGWSTITTATAWTCDCAAASQFHFTAQPTAGTTTISIINWRTAQEIDIYYRQGTTARTIVISSSGAAILWRLTGTATTPATSFTLPAQTLNAWYHIKLKAWGTAANSIGYISVD